MITNAEIRDAIAVLIKERAALPLKVYFNRVHNSAEDYAFVAFRNERVDEGFNYFVRRLRVDIQIVLAPLTADVKHTDLLDIADKLDVATRGYVDVADRKITIYDTSATIFDGILTYSFLLNFADNAPLPEDAVEYELGEHLQQKIKIGGN